MYMPAIYLFMSYLNVIKSETFRLFFCVFQKNVLKKIQSKMHLPGKIMIVQFQKCIVIKYLNLTKLFNVHSL